MTQPMSKVSGCRGSFLEENNVILVRFEVGSTVNCLFLLADPQINEEHAQQLPFYPAPFFPVDHNPNLVPVPGVSSRVVCIWFL